MGKRSKKLRGGCVFQPRYTRKGKTRISETYMIQYRVNGRLIRESAKTDEKKAYSILTKKMADAQEGKHTLPTKQTLAVFLGAYLEGQRQTVDAGTWTRYEFCKKNLLADGSPLAKVKLGKLTVGLLSEYLTHRLNAGASKATVLKELNWLKGRWAKPAATA